VAAVLAVAAIGLLAAGGSSLYSSYNNRAYINQIEADIKQTLQKLPL